MTTVACVWVRGHVRYPVEYVTRLAAMVRRHLDRPYRFVVLTDRPEQLPVDLTADVVRIPSPAPLFGWWAKIEYFNPAHAAWLTGRVLALDLDVLVVQSLAPILDYAAPFALVPHAGSFRPKPPRAVVRRFNSSVMVWEAGIGTALYQQFTPDVADRLWGDQDWIGEQQPQAATMPAAWFPRLSDVPDGPTPEARVVLVKKPKPHDAARRWAWVDHVWRVA